MIDKIFRGYGENYFGKDKMDLITDAQVEEARVAAFTILSELTAVHGRQEKGTCEKLFLDYVELFFQNM